MTGTIWADNVWAAGIWANGVWAAPGTGSGSGSGIGGLYGEILPIYLF